MTEAQQQDSGQVDGTEGQQNAPETGEQNQDTATDSNKIQLTQDELDAKIEARLERARKKWADEAEEQKRLAKMDAKQRAEAEREKAERERDSALTEAKEMMLSVRAERVALEQGIRPDRVEAALKIADLKADTVEFDGREPNADAIKTAIGKVVKNYPEWVGQVSYGEAPDVTTSGQSNGIDESTPEAVQGNWIASLLANRQ